MQRQLGVLFFLRALVVHQRQRLLQRCQQRVGVRRGDRRAVAWRITWGRLCQISVQKC